MIDCFIANDLNRDDLSDFWVATKAAVSKISHEDEILELGSLGSRANVAF